MKYLIPLLVLDGCHDSLRIRLQLEGPDDRRTVLDAADILELPVRFTDDPYGAVTLTLVDFCDPILDGFSRDVDGCDREAVSNRNRRAVAHELGHVLGLGHTADPENFMHEIAGEKTTLDQLDALTDEVATMNLGCP